jgi:hypothetical protein
MLPENQPYYWPPRNPPRVDDSPSAAAIQLQDIFPADPSANKIVPLLGGGFPNADGTGMRNLSNWPVSFGEYSSKSTPIISTTICSLYNSDLNATAQSLSCFDWAVYGFNSGHFISSICLLGLPFAIVLASDKYANSRSLFIELSACTGPILGGCRALLDHIKASRITSNCPGILSIPGATIAPSQQADSGSCRLQLTQSYGSPARSQSLSRSSTQTTTVAQSPFNSSINSNRMGGSSLIR